MSRTAAQSIDLAYRPRTYFWPHGLKPHPLSSIKGANRKALISSVLAEDADADVPPVLLQPSLPGPLRSHLAGLHPSAMGGEYLPDLVAAEVEVARITIASTTQDVTCVYAHQAKDRIVLRVVDEYDGATLSGRTRRSTKQPLSLEQFVRFFLGAWDLFEVLGMNFEADGYPESQVYGFFRGSSDFYPDFDGLLRHRVGTFLSEHRGEDGE